jgi:hypothetical protein
MGHVDSLLSPDTERSLRFIICLGLKVAGESLNHGAAQEQCPHDFPVLRG